MNESVCKNVWLNYLSLSIIKRERERVIFDNLLNVKLIWRIYIHDIVAYVYWVKHVYIRKVISIA